MFDIGLLELLLIAVISLFNKGPAYFFFTYFVMLCIDACFLCEQENASFTYKSASPAKCFAKEVSFFSSSL